MAYKKQQTGGKLMASDLYSIGESFTESPSNANFQLHNHDEYEIFLFLKGDSKYVVEDRNYTLEPCDIIIIRKHEMHRIYHNRAVPYRRMVLMVSPAFFQENGCGEYESQFLKGAFGNGNKIAADLVRSGGLYDAFLRYKKYSEDFTLDKDAPILRSIVVEILYLINKITAFSASDFTGSPIKNVILYLNNNYTEDITLDTLEETFYLSKYYLCRTFHKATGLTIHEYIRRKRLTLVRELAAEGMNMGEAAARAGFHSYSSFYRAYVNEYGASPSGLLP